MMGYIDINTYYKLMFNLVQHHKYSLRDIYDMFPYERDIFIMLLEEYIREQEEEYKKRSINATTSPFA